MRDFMRVCIKSIVGGDNDYKERAFETNQLKCAEALRPE